MRLLFSFIAMLIILSTNHATAQTRMYWQQNVKYTMNLTLDEKAHELSGTERIIYYNNSPDELTEIWIHLYPNAFKNTDTYRVKMFRENYYSGGVSETRNGWLEIKEFLIKMPTAYDSVSAFAGVDTVTGDTIRQIKVVPVDWAKSAEHTVNEDMLSAQLPVPLAPGDSLFIDIDFVNHIRPSTGRSGYQGRHYDMAQWYPKMAVYDERGWDSDLWSTRGEFYGEFSNFNVTINVPWDYIVAATGVVVEGDPGWTDVTVDTTMKFSEWAKEMKEARKEKKESLGDDPMRTVRFKAEMVHDFAWNAATDYVYEHGIYESPAGPIDVHALFHTRVGERWTKKVIKRGIRVLGWLNDRFGQYPYPQVTIVKSSRGGGMEYPMLVMDGSESEGLICHEVGHIYFYGILGNDEQDEAWLDEGFTTFQTRKYFEHRFGPTGQNRDDWKLSDFKKNHYRYNTSWENSTNSILYFRAMGADEPIAQPVAKMKTSWGARTNAYTKPAAMLDMLLTIMGEENFYAGMREYFDTWKLKHVNEKRWRDVMRKHTDEDIDTFLDQWLYSDGWVDYALGGVSSKPSAEGYDIEVNVVNKGDFWTPVDVLVETDAGESILHRYSDKEKSGSFTVNTKGKPVKVVVDPNDRILDRNRMNNRKGLLKVEFMPDYPGMNYTPRDNYGVRYRPFAWYNDVDGAKLGLLFRGSYLDNYRNLDLDLVYGVKSEKTDFKFGWSHPLQRFSYQAKYSLAFGSREGRTFGDFHLYWNRSKVLFRQPVHRFSLGYSYLDTRNTDYVPVDSWETGVESKLYAGYGIDFRGWEWFANFDVKVQSSQDFLGADEENFNFSKIDARLKYHMELGSAQLYFRGFFGTSVAGDLLPPQEAYSIAGANGVERFDKFYLSAKGSMFGVGDLLQNYHMSGGGNVRGYLTLDDYVPHGERVASASIELRKKQSLPGVHKYFRKIVRTLTISAFADAGNIWVENGSYGYTGADTKSEMLVDAGIGVKIDGRRLSRRWSLRLDLPLFLSNTDPFGIVTELGGEEESSFAFRWVVSFGSSI